MQTFCTNCGQPLAAGAAFCPSCGTRVEAAPAATTASSVPPGTPPYAPGSSPQPSFTPAAPPAAPQKNQGPNWLGWLVGCLATFLAVIVVLIGLVIFGLLTHHLILFAIGLGGLVLMLLIGAAIEHQVRRLYRRFKYGIQGIERDIGIGGRPDIAGPRYRPEARRYQRQPSFSPIRFLFSLAVIAALAYGGLYLYYTQQFVGQWSGVLKIGATQPQGILANFQMSLPLHSPTNPSVNDPPSLAVTQVQLKSPTVQGCKNTQTTYQLSGTASRLDASKVAMTLNTGKETIQLTGAYQNDTFTLSGKDARGQPISLTLQKGFDQPGYVAACKG
jgi:hypothetical protein